MSSLIVSPPAGTGRRLAAGRGLAAIAALAGKPAATGLRLQPHQGGLIHTGQGKLDQLTLDAATLEAGASKLYIVLAGATYEAGPQLFFTPNLLSRFHVNGVAVRLANHDWLFLSDESLPALGVEELIKRLQ
jgi:hypothetical protein